MKNKIFLILLVVLFSGFLNFVAQAQTLSEAMTTPELLTETGAKLLISEVNFKNKDHDFVELYYLSPTGHSLNLKGLQFEDDQVFKRIDQDFVVNSGDYILLTFKSTVTDILASHSIFTDHGGLTGTTEQLILRDASRKVVDAICWSSKTPTDSEKTDQQNLFEAEGWISAALSSCVSSEQVTTNQSVVRINFSNDTDSKTDWTISDDISPKAPNGSVVSPTVITTPVVSMPAVQLPIIPLSSKTIVVSPVSSKKTSTQKNVQKVPVQPKKATSKTDPTKSSLKTPVSSAKTSKHLYQNGDLSEDIVINEILAHAKTDDRHNEWIELYNKGDSDVNLGNWQLDDLEGGSKPYLLPDTLKIKAQGFVLIKAGESKLSLANQKDEVRLFDYEGTLLQTVPYENAPIDQSFSRVMVQQVDGTHVEQWFWDKLPTPEQPNADYQELIGVISADADFSKDYSFLFEDAAGGQSSTQKVIHFDESFIPGPLAKATFIKGAKAKLLVSKSGDDASASSDYLLRNYEILTDPVNSGGNFWFLASILGAAFIAGVATLLFFLKKLPLQKLQAP